MTRRHLLATLAGLFMIASCQEDSASAPHPDSRPEFRRVADISNLFAQLEREHGQYFKSETLGNTVLGAKIPLLRITNCRVRTPKIGVWLDAAIHGGELASAEIVLAVIDSVANRVAGGVPPGYLDRVELLLVPVLNVDGYEESRRLRGHSQRRNATPTDDDGDGLVDEDPPEDIDGDGMISAVLRRGVQIGMESTNPDGDERVGEDGLGGVDLNRDFPDGRTARVRLQPETRGVVQFWERNPHIEIALSFHTSFNCLVLPTRVQIRDRPAFDELASFYSQATGFSCFDLPDSEDNAGTNFDWFYERFSAIAAGVEVSSIKPSRQDLSPSESSRRVAISGVGEVELVPSESGLYQAALLDEMEEIADLHLRWIEKLLCNLPLTKGT